jgi:DNA-directed RNA polymerase subunit RPC12/RpoP
MVKIKCLVCGRTIQIPGFVDTNNYDGQVACPECASLLHVKLVGEKVRKYSVVERKNPESQQTIVLLSPDGHKQTASDLRITDADQTRVTDKVKESSAGSLPVRQTGETELDVESVARYNPLRDFLATYRASQIHLAFEQIESIIGAELEKAAYTFKSWWENDRSHPQAIAWLEAGWEVAEVALEQRKIVLRRVGRP